MREKIIPNPGTDRPCNHGKVTNVHDGAGKVIGRQCAYCLQLLSALGICSHCGRGGRLSFRNACSEECSKALERTEAKARSAARKAFRESQQTWEFGKPEKETP